MPVRSLNSSVLRWPGIEQVDAAVRAWVRVVCVAKPEIRRIGYFGSYARRDAGVGSDLDIVLVVDRIEGRYEHRTRQWDTTSLPVPVDLLVYTQEEFDRVCRETGFGDTLARETVWVYERGRNSP